MDVLVTQAILKGDQYYKMNNPLSQPISEIGDQRISEDIIWVLGGDSIYTPPLRSQSQGGDMGKVVGEHQEPAGYVVNFEHKISTEGDMNEPASSMK